MPPTSDGIRTVGCPLEKLVPLPEHLYRIRNAVSSTHKATILATELLNMHLRKCLEQDPTQDLSSFFSGSWLLNAYNEVTYGKRSVKVVPELRATKLEYMPPFNAPDRTGIQQCLLYDARNLATVAATTIWLHFQPRMLSHVRRIFDIKASEYSSLSKEEKRKHKLEVLQVASDMCQLPSQQLTSPPSYHEWIASERKRLHITNAFTAKKDEPFLYQLKARPHQFLYPLYLISKEREANGKGAFCLYPLRRSMVPRHVRFDQKALRDLLGFGRSDYIKEKAKRQKTDTDLPKRRTKEEMHDENEELFQQVLDTRAANVQMRHRFDHAFTTDGVCARVQMKVAEKGCAKGLPKRGIWAIDELKHSARLQDLHVIGIDPGKRELVVGVDMDNPLNKTVRYTQRQRLKDIRSRQYADESQREKPTEVQKAERELSGYNSRSVDLNTFCAYCAKRHETMEVCLMFYSTLAHRRRRWKTCIKTQQSEERLYKKFESLKTDTRPLVLAYGSWGLIAGKAGAACNKGNPPCIGVGLMRKLSKRFLVVPTPEAYTSKTCSKCFGECGPCIEKEEEAGKKIRGLRRCTQRDCMLFLNRDKNGATNIGTNFNRLFMDEGPIRSMSEEDLAFHRAKLCLECTE